jgi:branched-chain amino acid transport system substrate-binding protein
LWTGKPLRAAEPIKIEAVLIVTGRSRFIGILEKEVMEIVAEEINRRGEIAGRQIEVYFEDDQSNPTNTAIAATKWIRDKKVCYVICASLLATNILEVLPRRNSISG